MTFALFDPPQMGNLMTPVEGWILLKGNVDDVEVVAVEEGGGC